MSFGRLQWCCRTISAIGRRSCDIVRNAPEIYAAVHGKARVRILPTYTGSVSLFNSQWVNVMLGSSRTMSPEAPRHVAVSSKGRANSTLMLSL